jgi:putative ABC transport system permease protein
MGLVLPPSEREFFLGDLDEEFQQHVRSRGVRAARRWYWRQAFQTPGWWRRTSPELAPNYAEIGKGEIMLGIVQDIRYSFRSLLKSRSLVAFALVALAIGIGANTIVFSLVNGVLLNPLPYAQPERLVRLWESPPTVASLSVRPVNFLAWEKENTAFDSLGAYREDGFSLSSAARDTTMPERVAGARVTAGLFRVLGVSAEMGRWFTSDEDRPGSDRVIVISHDLWQRRFGSDPKILGKDVRVEGAPRTVVGVMPRGFRVPIEGAELWIPYAIEANKPDALSNSLRVLGRLKPNVTLQQAQTELNGIERRIEEEQRQPTRGWRVPILRLDESITADIGVALWIVLGCVGLVLLIACANVANLLLVRSVARRKEFALRLSLGASRQRLLQQLLIESLLLSLAGGALGISLAAAGLPALKNGAPGNIPRLADVSIDPRVLAFTFALSIATGLLFGTMPALRGSRLNLIENLKVASHGGTHGRRDHRAGRLLVVAQITIAMVVVVSSGLMLRTLWNLRATDPGFKTDERLTFGINLSSGKYARPADRSTFISDLINRIRTLPGVRNVAATHRLPMTGQSGSGAVRFEGKPDPKPGENPIIIYRAITPDYFSVMGIPLLRGRTFDSREARESAGAVVVNQRMAARFWPGEDPIGKRIQPWPQSPWLTVVGVAADSKEIALTADGAIGMYIPDSSINQSSWTFIVHTASDVSSIANAIAREVQSLDSDVAVAAMMPLDSVVTASIGSRNFAGALLSSFAAIALMLAAAGIYGTLAYIVNQRTREIGLRMALGANRKTVLKQVMTSGLRLIVPGIAAGGIGAFAGTRLLSRFLYGVKATDPVTFLAIAVFMILIGGLACYIPARKAASVDPLLAIRNE